jgi:hypothetical protein
MARTSRGTRILPKNNKGVEEGLRSHLVLLLILVQEQSMVNRANAYTKVHT